MCGISTMDSPELCCSRKRTVKGKLNQAGIQVSSPCHTLHDAPETVVATVHVFETSERGRTAHYKLTSTVMLYMSKELSSPTDKTDTTTGTGGVTLGGNMTRQVRFSLCLRFVTIIR